jgi:hypothetical protein
VLPPSLLKGECKDISCDLCAPVGQQPSSIRLDLEVVISITGKAGYILISWALSLAEFKVGCREM